MARIINKEEFENDVLKSKKLVLVDFFATWCGPCQMLAPILEELSKENQDFEIVKIDIDQERDLAIENKIEFVPTIVLFKQGKEVDRITGVLDKNEILEKVKLYK